RKVAPEAAFLAAGFLLAAAKSVSTAEGVVRVDEAVAGAQHHLVHAVGLRVFVGRRARVEEPRGIKVGGRSALAVVKIFPAGLELQKYRLAFQDRGQPARRPPGEAAIGSAANASRSAVRSLAALCSSAGEVTPSNLTRAPFDKIT